MRRVPLLLLSVQLLLAASVLAQGAATLRPFRSAMFERHPAGFYAQQARASGKVAAAGCGDDAAWVYAYKYAQYANRRDGPRFDLDSVVAAAAAAGLTDDDFALAFLRAAHTRDFAARAAHLKRAYRDRPGHHATYTGLAAHYEVTGQQQLRDEMLRRISEAKPIPPSVVDYNYNRLNSVAADGILLTYGDADTFPSWLLQALHGHRPDVRVINWSLLAYAEGYRATVSRELGVELPDARDEVALLDALARTGRPVYVNLARDRSAALEGVGDRCAVTGLAL